MIVGGSKTKGSDVIEGMSETTLKNKSGSILVVPVIFGPSLSLTFWLINA